MIVPGLCCPHPAPALLVHPEGPPHTLPGPVLSRARCSQGSSRPRDPVHTAGGRVGLEPEGGALRGGRRREGPSCGQRAGQGCSAGPGSWAVSLPLPPPAAAPGVRLSRGRPWVWWEAGADCVCPVPSFLDGCGRDTVPWPGPAPAGEVVWPWGQPRSPGGGQTPRQEVALAEAVEMTSGCSGG